MGSGAKHLHGESERTLEYLGGGFEYLRRVGVPVGWLQTRKQVKGNKGTYVLAKNEAKIRNHQSIRRRKGGEKEHKRKNLQQKQIQTKMKPSRKEWLDEKWLARGGEQPWKKGLRIPTIRPG